MHSGRGMPGTTGDGRPCTVVASTMPFVGDTITRLQWRRGPAMRPLFTASLNPASSPPRSRAVVQPTSRVVRSAATVSAARSMRLCC